jgi:hypothetical protein
MKIAYETIAELTNEDTFQIMKEFIEQKTGKKLANIKWFTNGACQLVFCNETVDLDKVEV